MSRKSYLKWKLAQKLKKPICLFEGRSTIDLEKLLIIANIPTGIWVSADEIEKHKHQNKHTKVNWQKEGF